MRDHKQAGFTLIEVLVASAIVMVSMGVLMQLFASGLDRVHRAGQSAHVLTAQRVIIHRLEVLNPALKSEGKGIAEGLAYHWRATQRAPFRPLQDGKAIDRALALFTIAVELATDRDKVYTFNVDRVGWRNGS